MKAAMEDPIPDEMLRPALKANPIPRSCSVQIYEKKMKDERLKRDEKIRKDAELSFAKAVTPGPLKRAIERKKKAAELPPK
jgi:hypothetical protein